MMKTPLKAVFFALAISASFTACKTDDSDNQNTIDDEVFDPNSSLNTVFDGKIFSIPSPIQTANFIKDLGLPFDESLLNDQGNTNNYVTEYQQALNLGVYGADLGYSALYEQKGAALRYLTSVEKLTAKLGLSSAFDQTFLERFEKNSEIEDSMVVLMSDAFSEADDFLKKANRKSTSALVLTGGFIETMYFACELNSQKSSDEMIRRIAEQKDGLESIIGVLTEYNKGGSSDELIDQLKSLQMAFDQLDLKYEYEAPDTDKENKVTSISHHMNVEVDPGVIEEIRTKVKEIRANIIKG